MCSLLFIIMLTMSIVAFQAVKDIVVIGASLRALFERATFLLILSSHVQIHLLL